MKEGWEYKKLDDICTIVGRIGFRGYTKADLVDSPNDGAITLSPSNITNGELDFSKCTYISWDKYNESPEIMLTKGDVVLVKTASIGKCAVVKELPHKATLNPQFVVLKGIIGEPNFIGYYLKSPVAQITIKQMAGGVAIPTLSQKKLGTMLIPSPPLSEQQSIVDYLDSAFAKIDAMKANAEKALNEAKALFQASLKEMLEPKEGWEEKKMGDICEIIRGKRFVRTDIVEEGVPCIHYGDIYTHYGLSVTKTRGCIKPELAKKMRFAEKNDVVVVQAGENNWDIGVGIAYFGDEPAAVHDACFILKHKQNPMYVSYYLRSYNYHWYLLDYVHEGKICSFLKPALENAPISLPPLSEQQSIVATLDSLKSKVDRLQENFDKISQECDALKQAILRQVFE